MKKDLLVLIAGHGRRYCSLNSSAWKKICQLSKVHEKLFANLNTIACMDRFVNLNGGAIKNILPSLHNSEWKKIFQS